jgi:hypothetical protein
MAFHLLKYRVRVQLDAGKTNMGTIVESNLGGWPGLYTEPQAGVGNPDSYTHIAFLESGAEVVTIDGDPFVVMHMHNILAYIT